MDVTKLSEAQLVELIEKSNKQYWTDGVAEITDPQYDALKVALAVFNPRHPLLDKVDIPVVKSDKKVVHERPMLSLDKKYSKKEIFKWMRSVARTQAEIFVLQPKYDGISSRLIYGKTLATRGNGTLGEDITSKIPLITFITDVPNANRETMFMHGTPDPMQFKTREIDGEIVISDTDFQQIYLPKVRRPDGSAYKNSRNAVSGVMNTKDISSLQAQGARLTFVDYNCIRHYGTIAELETQWVSIINDFANLPFPQDGMVIKLVDANYCKDLGNTAHHPKWAMSFKFTNSNAESPLIDIVWSFGKMELTPVGVFKPIELGGVTIRRANLHNVGNLIDNDIQIGDIATIERAGDVIPDITSTRPGKVRKSAIIYECPCCGTSLLFVGPHLYCPNKQCYAMKICRLTSAVEKLEIDYLGEKTIRKLVDNLSVSCLKDIFNLKLKSLISIDGFATTSANKLLNEIDKAKTMHDYQLLAALNIPTIGVTLGKVIMMYFTFSELRRATIDDLVLVPGIGNERAKVIVAELALQDTLITELLSCVTIKQTKGTYDHVVPQVMKSICFTGKMPEPRAHYAKIATERGFVDQDRVNKDTAMLVVADVNSTSSKTQQAKKLGVPIVALDEWLAKQ